MKLNCDIRLPASKSESNRALMIAAYGGFGAGFQNLSESQDTKVMKEALDRTFAQSLIDSNRATPSPNDIRVCAKEDDEPAVHVIPCGECGHGIYAQQIDVKDCGTAARFLTTYLACREGEWLLTGTERMQRRPIGELVQTLIELGADIQYVERDGCLPLRIKGEQILGGKVSVDMSQSSQFASSLLLAAPMWPQGLELELTGSLNSLPYLDMTLALMRHFGAEAERKGRTVSVVPKPYQSRDFVVSSDWTAASYWYEMAALCEDCEIVLRGPFARRFGRLSDHKSTAFEPVGKLDSLQGDAIIAEWMKSLGVNTLTDGNALVLRKIPFEKKTLSFDFSLHPDLFPTMAAVCAGLQIEARFTGVATLKLKESDRVEAMREELSKIGTELKFINGEELVLKPSEELPFNEAPLPLLFHSHDDHRVVMALAPLAMRIGAVAFDHPEVVTKSYPSFWSDARFLEIGC